MHVKERWHRSEKSGTLNGYVMKEEIIFWRMELLFVRSDVKWLFRGCKSAGNIDNIIDVHTER